MRLDVTPATDELNVSAPPSLIGVPVRARSISRLAPDSVKKAFDVSMMMEPLVWEMRTKQAELETAGKVTDCEPSFGVFVSKSTQPVPPLVEIAKVTLPTVPNDVQVIVCDAPAVNISAPLGLVTVSAPLPTNRVMLFPRTEKFDSFIPELVPSHQWALLS